MLLIFFIGWYLTKAIMTLGIPGIRTTDTALFSESPVLFVFVAKLKRAVSAFSVFYVVLVMSKVAEGK